MNDSSRAVIRTPDQRLRVFISSTLQELADERAAAAQAVKHLRLAPVMFELGARPHAPRALYRAYLAQSDVFVGIYWQRYGWVAPGEDVSGLEDEYRLAEHKPKLIYVKTPAPDREPRLTQLLGRIKGDDHTSYKTFSTLAELRALLENDLAILLSERFLETAEAEVAPAAAPSHSPLPAPTSSFVGRQREVHELRRLLSRKDVRLVTLTGPGGVGKTRLSLEVAHALERTFTDGVAFISLASTNDSALVLASIAQQLGVRDRGASQPLERLAEYLRNKRTLLVLDNFEQIVTAAPDIASLLETCPALTLLVTSRAALRVRGEHEMVVHPLDVAAADQVSPAVRLFLERARAIKPDFAQDPAEQAAVEEICRRLDGLPLAIELASARVKILSAQAILARLDDSLQLLTGGARDLPARQRTLRGTLDWSYQLLEPAERSFLARLAVFGGGWTLEAAEAVCQCDGADVLDMLMGLVDRSLVYQLDQPDQRFGMLATIRDYARELLDADPDAAAVFRAHAEYVLQVAEKAAARLRGSDQHVWRNRLAAEQDNVRLALRWLLDTGELQMAARLQTALAVYWWVQGYTTEARRWSDELLAREAAMQPGPRARAHLTSGLAAAWEGDYARAVPLRERSVGEFRELAETQFAGVAQMALAYVAPSGGNYQQTEAMLLESAADLYQAGDLWALNVALQSRAEVALAAGDAQRARALYQDSLELAKDQADMRARVQALVGLGFVDLVDDDPDAAAELLRESVPLSTELANPELLAHALRGLAGVALAYDQLPCAARLLGAAQALSDAAGTVDWPVRRMLYIRIEQDVRNGLGLARFAEAVAAGRGLSMADAAAFALAVERPVGAAAGLRRCA